MTKYDNNFKEVWTYDYLPKEGTRVTSFGMRAIKDKFLWMYVEEPSRKERDYFIASIDRRGELGEQVKVNSLGFNRPSDEPNLSWAVSEDSTMVAVIQTFDNNVTTLDFEYDVQVLDSELNLLWESSVWLKGKSQNQIQVLSFVLGNDGVFYALVKEYEDRKAKESKRKKTRKGKSKVPGYELKIYKLGKGMKKPEILAVNIKDKFAKGASLAIDEQGIITCVGMYGNDRRGNINGVFFQKLDAKGQIEITNQKEFSTRDLDILGRRNSDSEKDGTGSIEGVFGFSNQLTQLDGSIVISAEHNFTRSTRDANGNVQTNYVSQDIVVIHFEPDGELRHINLIPKRQSSGSPLFLYHSTVALDNHPVYFIFNDNKANIDRPIDKRPKAMKNNANGVATINYIDDRGNLQKEVLVSNREIRSLLVPYTIKRIDENSFIFISMRAKAIGRSSFYIGTAVF